MDSEFELHDPPFGYEAPPFDPGAYPRSYQIRPQWRALQFALCAALAIGGVAILAWQALNSGLGIASFIAIIVAVVGLAGLLTALRYEVVLHADAIEVHGAFRTRRMAVSEMAGLRWQALGNGFRGLLLVARPGAGSNLRLDTALARDAAFDAWIAQLEDLDANQRNAARAAILSSSTWGATPADRWKRLRNYQVAVGLMAYVIMGLAAASLVWRRDLDGPVWALAVVPPLLLLAVSLSRNRLRIDAASFDPRPSLFGPLSTLCVVLAARQFMETDLPQWWLVVLPALALGAALSAWAWRASAPLDSVTPRRWPLVPLACLYAAAVLVLLNGKLDHQAASEVERSVVTFKHWGNGRWRDYALSLDPVTSQGVKRTVQVPLALFNSVSPGETVCVLRHPGFFNWQWIDARPCPDNPVRPSVAGWPDALYRALTVGAYLPERRGPLLKQLLARQYDDLESRLSDLQRRFEQGSEDSIALLTTYRDFYDPNPELDPLFDAWLAKHPQSYSAYLARGIHRKFQAEQLHHAGFEKWVSPDANVEGVTSWQVADLEHSTSLTPKPLLSFVHLMDAARYRGQRTELRRLLDRGLAVDPGSLALTRKYLWMLSGDMEAMGAFVDECRAAGMPSRTLDSLQSILLVHRGWAALRNKNDDQALALLYQATALDAYSEDKASALREAAVIEAKRQHFETSRDLLKRATEADPGLPGHHAALAHSLWQLGQRQESVEETRRAAELGLASSQAYLGQLLLAGNLVPRDEDEAAKWLNRAAAAGDADARRVLREHPALRRP